MQLADAVVPDRVHGPPLKMPPVLLVVRATVPVGVMKVPDDVSVTVAMHEAESVVVVDKVPGVQVMLMVVARLFTVTLAVAFGLAAL